MILTQLHMIATLLIAMLLHIGIAVWFSLSEPAPKPVPEPPLKINLLATIAETTVNEVKPEPVIKKTSVKPPPVEPPLVEAKPVKSSPEPVEQIFQPSPTEASPAVLDAVATARYEQLLVAWLEKHKKYPRRAKRLRIEGEGMLRILIDRTGQTRQVSLERRTGNRLLDKAALEMARRANPFPPMPENDPRRKMEFIVPVAFVLQ